MPSEGGQFRPRLQIPQFQGFILRCRDRSFPVRGDRIADLTEQLLSRQKRPDNDRARQVCQTRATILDRRELGESLMVIAADLEMPYETVKTYAKLARRSLKSL